MKEFVADRLRKIEDLEQRQLLKDIVSGVFMNLVEYQEEMNRKLEDRVFNEIEDWEDNHDIYVTLCAKEDIDPIHESLYPMIPSDLEAKTLNNEETLDSLRKKEEVTLLTIFLESDFSEIKTLLTHQRAFAGRILTTDGHYDIQVSLQQNNSYIQEMEKLYHIFQTNGLAWKTVNNPFAYKFFDVVVIDCPQFNTEEEIVDVTIDFEEFEEKKRFDMILLWNIKKIDIKNIGFPMPAVDKVNYEHVLSIRKTGIAHGYLVDVEGDSIRYIKRSDNEITIVCPREKSGIWKLLKITKFDRNQVGSLNYELVSNRRVNRFSNKYVHKQAVLVKTKGEIIRMVNSFEVSQSVELVDVEIRDRRLAERECYPMNPFISDHIGDDSNKEVMTLLFRPREAITFISNDIMSFLVSEVQRYFSEYRCEGSWL
ncbi:normocyte-binding protein [Sporosarcina sp. FSL K6-3457]|uniref:normocyte-binding protein n=1 Tax=Sporosarcina sp. FSL K6-3457 TaxID=2978204 RepID=UPI0030F6E503